ncbi:hypothetical protein TRFO_14951 [Tritrichomonas foetus]|uniref:Uncharacterized protein n=1 Tax=Tritrichomonas foetus TaxID=1144522 RepID=A0A1J4KY58_9EUKA|nr:hypothetical protein TRFO_14951 [Tritrichomonas foetus]|eukprot:OHT14646.1 hypothetical protein TRFO_14951 [Tritrichomonas foetus]
MKELFQTLIEAIKHDNADALKDIILNQLSAIILYIHFSTPEDRFFPLHSFLFDVAASINSEKCIEFLLNGIPILSTEEEDSPNKTEEIVDISEDDFETLSLLTIITTKEFYDEYNYHIQNSNKNSNNMPNDINNNSDCEEEEEEASNITDDYVSLCDWYARTDFNEDDYPETVFDAFYIAANTNVMSITTYLLSCGLDASRISKYGTTVFNGAVFRRNYDLIDLLNDYYVKQTGDALGRFPLHISTKIKDDELTEYLLNNDSNPNCEDFKGFTPLHLAAKLGHYAVAEVLIDYEADLNHRDYCGRTPIHIAAAYGQTDMCALLYEAGALPELIDRDGMTPLNLATLRKKKQAARFFEDLGMTNANIEDDRFQRKRKSNKEQHDAELRGKMRKVVYSLR